MANPWLDSYDPSAYASETKKKKQGGVSGFLMENLPSLAAAGISFIPGVGTLGAAALGGAGEFVRQNLSGEKLDFGKIGGEAALSAIPGGIGKAAKFTKALATGTEMGATTAKAGRGASGALEDVSTRLEGRARNIRPGLKVDGAPIGVREATELNQSLTQQGLRGSARQQLEGLEQIQARTGEQLGDMVARGNRALSPGDLTSVVGRVEQNLGKLKGVSRTSGKTALVGVNGETLLRAGGGSVNHPYANDLMNDLKGIRDVKDIQDFKVKLDQDAINYGRNSNSPDPVKEQIAKAFRTGLSSELGRMLPELKGLQQTYGKNAKAETLLQAGAANPKGLGFGGSTMVPGEMVQTGASGLAEATTGLAGIMQKVAPFTNFGMQFAGQELARLPIELDKAADQAKAESADAAKAAEAPTGLEMDIDKTAPVAEETGSFFSPEVLLMLALNDLEKTGGKNLAQIKTLKDLFGEDAKAKKPLSAEASKQVANAKSGMDAIQMLRDEMAGGAGPTKNAAASLLGNVGRGVAGTQSFNAAKEEIIDVLARLRTGAAITKTEEERYKKALPDAFDSPEVIDQKLKRYETLFDRILSNQSQGSPELEVMGVGGL
jgi:hypothetical protein